MHSTSNQTMNPFVIRSLSSFTGMGYGRVEGERGSTSTRPMTRQQLSATKRVAAWLEEEAIVKPSSSSVQPISPTFILTLPNSEIPSDRHFQLPDPDVAVLSPLPSNPPHTILDIDNLTECSIPFLSPSLSDSSYSSDGSSPLSCSTAPVFTDDFAPAPSPAPLYTLYEEDESEVEQPHEEEKLVVVDASAGPEVDEAAAAEADEFVEIDLNDNRRAGKEAKTKGKGPRKGREQIETKGKEGNVLGLSGLDRGQSQRSGRRRKKKLEWDPTWDEVAEKPQYYLESLAVKMGLLPASSLPANSGSSSTAGPRRKARFAAQPVTFLCEAVSPATNRSTPNDAVSPASSTLLIESPQPIAASDSSASIDSLPFKPIAADELDLYSEPIHRYHYPSDSSSFTGFRPIKITLHRHRQCPSSPQTVYLNNFPFSERSHKRKSRGGENAVEEEEVVSYAGLVMMEGTKTQMCRSEYTKVKVQRGSLLRFELGLPTGGLELVEDGNEDEEEERKRECRTERFNSFSSWVEIEDQELPDDFTTW